MTDASVPGLVVSVSRRDTHDFSKPTEASIRLIEGIGVEGDAHAGATVQHRSRVARDPSQANLRQVHLIHAELLDELRGAAFDVTPGALGENVTTRGIDLLALPSGTRLHLGADAVVEVTGLRNPALSSTACNLGSWPRPSPRRLGQPHTQSRRHGHRHRGRRSAPRRRHAYRVALDAVPCLGAGLRRHNQRSFLTARTMKTSESTTTTPVT